MPRFRPRPHHPQPGSVRPQESQRLISLRTRLARRWQRRRRRQSAFLALALLALASTVLLMVLFVVTPTETSVHRVLERVTLGSLALLVLILAIYALWRYDRVRRRARSAQIRLLHVQRRLASLSLVNGAERAEPNAS
jgi:peptidoglycan/LPS O-acetylase OafA/YrhL